MKTGSPVARNVQEYIEGFPKEMQLLLSQVRAIILKAAPKAEEMISYNMPAYKLNGPLVYFAGYKKHIGFYPTPSGIYNFEKELAAYVTSKGAIQFPTEKPLPTNLIKQIVQFRVMENLEKSKR